MTEHPFISIRNNKVYRKPFSDCPEREIGEVKESPELTFAYFEKRFGILEEKVLSLEEQVKKSENKGSFLQKIIHFKEGLCEKNAIGDYVSLVKRIDIIEDEIKSIVKQNKLKNFEIKNALLSELLILKDHYNLKESGIRIKEIQQLWVRTGSVDESKREELEEAYKVSLDHFYNRKSQFYADKELMLKDNVLKYETLLKEIEETSKIRDPNLAFEKLKDLQEKWKNAGKIEDEFYKEIFEKFKLEGEKIFKRFTESKKKEKKNSKKVTERILMEKSKLYNLIKKVDLEDADHLEKEKEKIIKEWKKLGDVFNKDIKEINNQFNREVGLINEKIFISKLAERKNSNFNNLTVQSRILEKVKLLKKLIDRDVADLEKYHLNMEIFNTGSGKADNLLNNRLKDKERRIALKKTLLNQWTAQLKKLK